MKRLILLCLLIGLSACAPEAPQDNTISYDNTLSISRVEGPRDIPWNSTAAPFFVFLQGEVTFPVQVRKEVVSCPANLNCPITSATVRTPNNPIQLTHACNCSGSGCPQTVRITRRVTVVDAKGNQARSPEYAYDCRNSTTTIPTPTPTPTPTPAFTIARVAGPTAIRWNSGVQTFTTQGNGGTVTLVNPITVNKTFLSCPSELNCVPSQEITNATQLQAGYQLQHACDCTGALCGTVQGPITRQVTFVDAIGKSIASPPYTYTCQP